MALLEQAVVNYDAPRTLETYLHRVGRTARAGAAGQSLTLVEDADRNLLRDILKKTKAAIKQRLVPSQARQTISPQHTTTHCCCAVLCFAMLWPCRAVPCCGRSCCAVLRSAVMRGVCQQQCSQAEQVLALEPSASPSV
jgi:superfamily II DNA helicase RecQ